MLPPFVLPAKKKNPLCFTCRPQTSHVDNSFQLVSITAFSTARGSVIWAPPPPSQTLKRISEEVLVRAGPNLKGQKTPQFCIIFYSLDCRRALDVKLKGVHHSMLAGWVHTQTLVFWFHSCWWTVALLSWFWLVMWCWALNREASWVDAV